MMNSVNKFTDRFTDEINSICNFAGKNLHIIIFLLCFNFFSHHNSLGIYRGNISVDKIPQKFTDRNIPSVFLFVFIGFLVVKYLLKIIQLLQNTKQICRNWTQISNYKSWVEDEIPSWIYEAVFIGFLVVKYLLKIIQLLQNTKQICRNWTQITNYKSWVEDEISSWIHKAVFGIKPRSIKPAMIPC